MCVCVGGTELGNHVTVGSWGGGGQGGPVKLARVRAYAHSTPATLEGEFSAATASNFSKEPRSLDFYMKPP